MEKATLGCHGWPCHLHFWDLVFTKFWLIVTSLHHIHFNSNVKLCLFYFQLQFPQIIHSWICLYNKLLQIERDSFIPSVGKSLTTVNPQGKKKCLKIFYREKFMCAKLLQLCLILYNPMDCRLLGSSVHGTLQARILEWVTLPSSRGSSWLRDWTYVS